MHMHPLQGSSSSSPTQIRYLWQWPFMTRLETQDLGPPHRCNAAASKAACGKNHHHKARQREFMTPYVCFHGRRALP